MFKKPIFEIETRLRFDTIDDAYTGIPFLKESLSNENDWKTIHYGHQLYHQDQILRIGEIRNSVQKRLFLGWKGPDQGQFANIREELDEEITAGIEHSAILASLQGKTGPHSSQSAVTELERLGYAPFMSFTGFNRSGFYQPLQVHLKLMHCPTLAWPLLVEIEKTATDLKEAYRCQSDLTELIHQLDLAKQVVRDEPPTLLYKALFASN